MYLIVKQALICIIIELLFPYLFFLLDLPPTKSTPKPKVQHEFTRKEDFRSYQVSNFKCDFSFLTDAEPNKPYLYQVYWYINGKTVHVTEAVKKEEFTKTFLNENNGIAKMGIEVLTRFALFSAFQIDLYLVFSIVIPFSLLFS